VRVLFGTNLLASAIAGLQKDSTAAPTEVFRRWESNEFDLVVSDHILGELARTLSEPYFANRIPLVTRHQAVETLRLAASTPS